MVRLEAEAIIRRKNQVTLPEAVARHLGLEPGDRLVFIADEVSEHIRVWPLRRSYAGALAGVYGDEAEPMAYLEAERESWDR